MLGFDYPNIRAKLFKATVRRFLTQYHHRAYWPDGYPLIFPAEIRPEWMFTGSTCGMLDIHRLDICMCDFTACPLDRSSP